MKENDLIKLIKFDYANTLSFIDKTDNILFKIRNWAIVTNGAIFALAITHNNGYIVLVNFFLICCFWVFELFYKCFHEDAIQKSYLIEEILNPTDKEVKNKLESYVFGLGHAIKPINLRSMCWIVFSKKRIHMTSFYPVLLILNLILFLVLSPCISILINLL